MLCGTFTLGSEIILPSISPAPMCYGHIAEVPCLNALPGDIEQYFYGQENMFVPIWWALLPNMAQRTSPWPRVKFLRGEDVSYLCFFSLPEVKWLLTNPKEVPLNMNDTPTAPLLPGKREAKNDKKLIHLQAESSKDNKAPSTCEVKWRMEKRNSLNTEKISACSTDCGSKFLRVLKNYLKGEKCNFLLKPKKEQSNSRSKVFAGNINICVCVC